LDLTELLSHALPRPEPVIDHRPWGRFDLLALNAMLSVKILTISPECRLSLQRHTGRDEWWHVLDTDLVVEIDGDARAVDVGDRVWIPRGTTHRIANRGIRPARCLELAYGHFDEDDIERLADDFSRVPTSLPERP